MLKNQSRHLFINRKPANLLIVDDDRMTSVSAGQGLYHRDLSWWKKVTSPVIRAS